MSEDASPTPAPPAIPPPPAPGPAATVVIEGTKTEREIELEKQLEEAQQGLKKVQTDAAYLQDENFRLKQVPAVPPTPAPKKQRAFVTLLHDPED